MNIPYFQFKEVPRKPNFLFFSPGTYIFIKPYYTLILNIRYDKSQNKFNFLSYPKIQVPLVSVNCFIRKWVGEKIYLL